MPGNRKVYLNVRLVSSHGMKLGSLRNRAASVVAPEAVLLVQAYFISRLLLLVK